MSTDAHDLPHLHNLDTEIVARYIDQPPRLPAELRRQVEASWNGAPVQLYALADLDHALRLTQVWVALGPGRLAMARRVDRGEQWEIESVERARIQAVREAPGLSATTLTILGRPGDVPLAVLRYSHRQRRAFENLKFVLEEALEGRSVTAPDADAEYAASVARPMRVAQALVAGRRVAVIRRLLGYLAPYRRQLTLGMAAATLITLVSLVPPYLAGYVIDRVVRPAQEGRLDVARAGVVAWVAVGAMALVYLVRQAAALVRLRLMSVLGEWVARDLRAELYEHLQRLSLAFFSRKRTGSLITRVSADTDRLWEFLAFGVVDVSLSLVMLAGLGAVLVSLDWRLGLVMIIPVPLFCWAIYRHGEALNRVFLRVWRKWSRLTDVLSDTMPGIRVVKAFNQEAREVTRFGGHNDDVTDEINRLHCMWTTFWPLLMLAVHATTLGVWVLAVPRLLGGGPPLSAGTFVSFLLYTTMFVGPIEVIGQMARTMQRATTSAHRVFEVLDTEPDVRDAPRPLRLEPVRARRVPDVGLGVQDLEHAMRRSRGALHGARHLADDLDRPDEHRGVQEERDERSRRQRRPASQQARHGQHPHTERGRVHREHQQRPERGPHAVQAVDLVRHVVVVAAEPRDLAGLLVECLDDADTGHRVGQDVRQPRPLAPYAQERPVERLAVPVNCPAEERHRDDHDQAEPPVE